jgi:hypothetical protein
MRRGRAASVAITALLVAGMRWQPLGLRPDDWLALVALPLGYGHLLGALLFARRRRASRRSLAGSLLTALALLNLLAAYLWALRTPGLAAAALAPMLLVSAWHIAENDLALARAGREGLRLGPVPRAAGPHGVAAVWAAAIGLLALTTPAGAHLSMQALGRLTLPVQHALSLEEIASAVLLYHAVAWVVFFERRARALPRAPAWRLRRRLLLLHALPLAASAASFVCLPGLHAWLASPALYLFASVLHAFHTAAARGLAPRRTSARAWAAT